MKVGVFHPGTQHSWQTSLALQQLDRLAWYATSLFYKPDEWPYRLERYLPGSLRAKVSREFRRFSMPALDPALVHAYGGMEWLERIANRLGWREAARRLDMIGNRQFVRQIGRLITEPGELALWGYNGSSLGSFELARRHGRPCILDRTIGDSRAYNAAMAAIQDRYGEWFLPVDRAVDSLTIEQDEQEYALADHILVGCEYAARTVRECATTPGVADKVRVLSYCYDEQLFAGMPKPAPVAPGRPVRFLYLGLIQARKGIQHVLEAIAQLPRSEAELTIIGDLRIPREIFARYADRVNYCPTVPRSEVARIMGDHDVFLLPSYHEGAGITLYEALAAGMALIQSDRCALTVTPETGVMLDTLDTESLLAAMRRPIDDRALLDSWRGAAQAEAARYSFANYRDNIAAFLAEVGI